MFLLSHVVIIIFFSDIVFCLLSKFVTLYHVYYEATCIQIVAKHQSHKRNQTSMYWLFTIYISIFWISSRVYKLYKSRFCHADWFSSLLTKQLVHLKKMKLKTWFIGNWLPNLLKKWTQKISKNDFYFIYLKKKLSCFTQEQIL